MKYFILTWQTKMGTSLAVFLHAYQEDAFHLRASLEQKVDTKERTVVLSELSRNAWTIEREKRNPSQLIDS